MKYKYKASSPLDAMVQEPDEQMKKKKWKSPAVRTLPRASPLVEVQASSSFGHINHDDKLKLTRYSDGTVWCGHCNAVMIFDQKQVKQLAVFFAKARKHEPRK